MTPDGFRRHSQWLKKESCFRDPVDAVCDFIVDLIHAYLSDKPELLCLHCAAVEFPEGLVLFPNTYRSGKSTLSAKLASRGLRLFSDDVLPLSIADRQGMALGILPRLRIPLPETADTHFKEYIDTHAGPANKRYHYSNLADTALAPLTEKAPIKGIVVLERTDEEPPSIIEANRGDMLKNVILRNFARQNTALNILDTLYALVEESACYVLKYNTLEEAANLLIEKFATSESTRSVSNRT
ncbi:hypothetical protein [Solemya velesiana gill symbiont]|uniref:hypothetical protein n=1 Tax=Solemya velesiana gill symbiont TaxID=1918948 RepID=UPI001083D92A|nr:hypothetical protein [Solemya velesiana gill symbiont]